MSHLVTAAAVASIPMTDKEIELVMAHRRAEAGAGNAVAVVDTPTVSIRKGQFVQYTGQKSGKTKTYLVGWAGPCNRTGELRLGLHLYGSRGKLFFVKASDVKLVS